MAVSLRHLQRSFVGLRARVAIENTRQSTGLRKALRQRPGVLVIVQVGGVHQPSRLLADHFSEARMRMPQRVDADSSQQIQIALAGSIVNVATFSALQNHRITRVVLQQVLLF